MPAKTFTIQSPTTNGDRIGIRETFITMIWKYGSLLKGFYRSEIYLKGSMGALVKLAIWTTPWV